ncbi:type II toxin-antitoxin system HicB family antitoxin [Phormidium tenue]|uniref:type II toxin-antitoxin system HicB family antitoxin n=1 Tax=Phormidium tenue TaxID=126344 RepID=UPI001F5545E8|nr:type II toxin-antitoxin system HicB family antitoxin [Phormidium tenue]
MDFLVLISQNEDGIFCASVPSLIGCVSRGETKDAAIANIKEAIALHIQSGPKGQILIEWDHEAEAFSATCNELNYLSSFGDTRQQAIINLKDAAPLMFEDSDLIEVVSIDLNLA